MTQQRRDLPPELIGPVPGPRSRALTARLDAAECPAFDARRKDREQASGEDFAPVVYERGAGSNVWDVDGNRFVDLTCGFGALSFGHVPAFVNDAVRTQSSLLGLALGDVYSAQIKVELLEALAALLPEPGARVMLGLSGADAVTAALKTAALATGKPGVVAFEGGYHGLSHGPLAACGLLPKFREPFVGQTGAFASFAPYPARESELELALARVEDLLARGDVGAVLVEPILGRGGCVVPPPTFLGRLRAITESRGVLLIADEIWTGMGRSGSILASVDANVIPDLICVGKALGAGLPISACIGRASAMAAWGAHGGTTLHTATHFGAPPACAAALAVLGALREGAVQGVTDRSASLTALLRRTLVDVGVREIRGRGLMIGIDLEGGAERALAVTRQLLARGYIVLTGGLRGDVITLTPAFDVDWSLFPGFAAALKEALAGSTTRT